MLTSNSCLTYVDLHTTYREMHRVLTETVLISYQNNDPIVYYFQLIQFECTNIGIEVFFNTNSMRRATFFISKS